MVLTDEEKKERHRLASKRYRERQKKKAKEGDKKAKIQEEKAKHQRAYSAATSFIRNKANKKELGEMRDLIAERHKSLMKKITNEKNK